MFSAGMAIKETVTMTAFLIQSCFFAVFISIVFLITCEVVAVEIRQVVAAVVADWTAEQLSTLPEFAAS